MPIYAYRCAACGHARDVLQRISDPLLVQCPACGAASFQKQLTAAGFQLKGSGWYATDFRNNNGGAAAAKPDDAAKPEATPKTDGATTAPAAPAAAAAAASTAAPAATAGGCAGSCACH